jgi:hypothetical protein
MRTYHTSQRCSARNAASGSGRMWSSSSGGMSPGATGSSLDGRHHECGHRSTIGDGTQRSRCAPASRMAQHSGDLAYTEAKGPRPAPSCGRGTTRPSRWRRAPSRGGWCVVLLGELLRLEKTLAPLSLHLIMAAQESISRLSLGWPRCVGQDRWPPRMVWREG